MDNTIHWLLAHAGPVIRYRVINEFCENSDDQQREEAIRDLLALPEMQKRLAQLANQDIDKIHGATFDCFENSLPMVLDFGLNNTNIEFCRCINIDQLIGYYEDSEGCQQIMYPLLYRAGYRNVELENYIKKRLNHVSEFTDKMDFDIYDDEEKHKSRPKTYRDRPVVRAELFADGNYRFPQIYDIIGFAELYKTADAEYQNKINSVIQYILAPEYNKFVGHYGAILLPNKRYHAIGWDCMLPLFHTDYGHQSLSMYVHRLEMFSVFPCVVQSAWFKTALAFFERCKTTENTYALGKDYLIELKNSCWFIGSHLGLGEDRRRYYQEIESTFRILRIKRNAGLC
jgi:hypothetical protein